MKRIASTSPMPFQSLQNDYPIFIRNWCDSKDDKHGGTGFKYGGNIDINGSYIGRASSEDAYAFILAHELSHYLYGHDELRIAADDNLITRDQSDPAKLEKLADESAVELISRAGYNPESAIEAIYLIGIDQGACIDT